MRLPNLFTRSSPAPVEPTGPDDDGVGNRDDGASTTWAEIRAEAEALVDGGHLVEAVDRLAAANRDRADADADAEIRLVELRHQAAVGYAAGTGRAPWPPPYDDPFPAVVGSLPEIDARDLTADLLGGAVAHHGGLVVRGVFSEAQVAHSIDAIHRTQSRRDDDRAPQAGSEPHAWYHPFETRGTMQDALRRMVAEQGGTWLADSPASTALILDELTSVGVIDAIAGHLGERPFFSLQKSTLRRSLPKNKLVAWHQDGSFLDPGVRTMNVWVALSRCGGDYPAPGLEVVPARLPEILPVDGELTPHSVAESLVAEIAAVTPLTRPPFGPGDGLLFDERFLHRTYLDANMTEDRYALECWLFAPSHPSTAYLPFLV